MKLPVTFTLATAITATTVVQRRLGDDRLQHYASTNLDNLATRPVRSLLLSAVVLERGEWLLQTAGVAGAIGLLERSMGSRRAVAVTLAGHLVPTAITQAAVSVGVRSGRLAKSSRQQVDVGTSYMVAAGVGALTRQLSPRARRVGLALVAAGTVAETAITRDVVATGHGLAFAVGYLGSRFFAARPASHSL